MTTAEFKPAFLITIDVEGDNVWARPRQADTRNAMFLPRFQALCEKHGLRPTYLTNLEMAKSPAYAEFAHDVLRRDAAEIGMHLHAWDTPPVFPLTSSDSDHQPYLTDYPSDIVHAKVAWLTDVLEQTFSRKMVSHRAGRWSMNSAYARALVASGYLVDCSVTPHVSWRRVSGSPTGPGGADYTGFPERPYLMNLDNISQRGSSTLLEVPMTVIQEGSGLRRQAARATLRLGPRFHAAMNRLLPTVRWFRPNGRNLASMLEILERTRVSGVPHLEFMLHSSELMPSGSPTFRTAPAIELLYAHLEELFSRTAGYVALTLAEFHKQHAADTVTR